MLHPSPRRVDVAGVLRRTRGSLLSEPISSLLQSLERDQFERAVAESAAAQRQRTPGAGRAGGGGGGSARGASSLWVQKHAPRSYIDLLSDEQINRCALGARCMRSLRDVAGPACAAPGGVECG